MNKMEHLLKHLPAEQAESERKLQAKSELKDSLSMLQLQALEYIGWFLYGGRATGRTYVAATATIIAALDNQGIWIPILDHTRLREHGESYILDIIRVILNKSGTLSLDMFEFKQTSIRYIGKPR